MLGGGTLSYQNFPFWPYHGFFGALEEFGAKIVPKHNADNLSICNTLYKFDFTELSNEPPK